MGGSYPYPIGLVRFLLNEENDTILTCHRAREWQKWPVTILTGAYIGYAVGKVLGGYVFRGARVKML